MNVLLCTDQIRQQIPKKIQYDLSRTCYRYVYVSIDILFCRFYKSLYVLFFLHESQTLGASRCGVQQTPGQATCWSLTSMWDMSWPWCRMGWGIMSSWRWQTDFWKEDITCSSITASLQSSLARIWKGRVPTCVQQYTWIGLGGPRSWMHSVPKR